MPRKVIHFGCDDCHRVQVLCSAGYEVQESCTLDALARDLAGSHVDAVIVCEQDERTPDQVADLVRRLSAVPLILFRRTQREIRRSQFDRVYESLMNPENWLAETAELIANTRPLIAGSPKRPART